MNGRRRRALLAAVTPMLEPGERVEVTSLVNLSTVSVRRTAAFGIASAIVSGGAVSVIPAPTPMYLAMTDRRLFVFRADPVFAKPAEHTMTIRREGLFRSEVRERFLNSSFVLSSPYSETSLKLVFPLIDRKARNQVAAALPLATA
ncbi:hypothetical protein [Streptomyces roseicoloratus]|uniref:YokE-like PH domain-containing protein n=1 Tax=Streptomyces roseicoloratus TaxID=2508722 RepID=A0ABY9RR27_9ACTN|nr:hypothetical protein [Streptomyces roseicoloratus]WMX44390.1 hypothetical protein RGF97_05320 [Streptomyces roseicoloratus]